MFVFNPIIIIFNQHYWSLLLLNHLSHTAQCECLTGVCFLLRCCHRLVNCSMASVSPGGSDNRPPGLDSTQQMCSTPHEMSDRVVNECFFYFYFYMWLEIKGVLPPSQCVWLLLVCPEFNAKAMRTLLPYLTLGWTLKWLIWWLIHSDCLSLKGTWDCPPPTASIGSMSGMDFLKLQCAGFSGI